MSKTKQLSGAYWYVPSENSRLLQNASVRTLLTVIAFMLQVVVLLLPQGGLEYITKHIESYAFTYMWIVFLMIGISIYVMIMNGVRYKFNKRIPVERAPRNGFKRRAFFGNELFMATNALMLAIEISFVCISYDGWGLLAIFICALALAASVWARQLTCISLGDAELIKAPEPTADGNADDSANGNADGSAAPDADDTRE